MKSKNEVIDYVFMDIKMPNINGLEMAKIIKHTFELPKLEVVDGELVENGTIEETYTFTLLHKGMGLFEELSDKPLMAYLMQFREGIESDDLNNLNDEEKANVIEKLLSRNFINNLACASYTKIEDNKFHNNRATAEEFKKTYAYQKLGEDIDFILSLISMATECLTEKMSSVQKSKANVNAKKQ